MTNREPGRVFMMKDNARTFEKYVWITIAVAFAGNVIAALLLCFGIFKPRGNHVEAQTTPVPDPKHYVMEIKMDDRPSGTGNH